MKLKGRVWHVRVFLVLFFVLIGCSPTFTSRRTPSSDYPRPELSAEQI
ncbi:MAG: hypothetical protein ACUVQ7_10025 [bacterium]